MSLFAQRIQELRAYQELPLSQIDLTNENKQQQEQQHVGLRKRLFSLSLNIRSAGVRLPTEVTSSWAFRRSKSLPSSMGEVGGNYSLVKRLGEAWSWILSQKPEFAKELVMNDEEAVVLGSQERGSWRHVLFRVMSELRKLVRSSDKVEIPRTYRSGSFS